MGIEFREGSLLITSKNNHVAKKGENQQTKSCVTFHRKMRLIGKSIFRGFEAP